VDGRTDVPSDGHFSPVMLLGLLTKCPFNGLIYRTTWAKRHQKGENHSGF